MKQFLLLLVCAMALTSKAQTSFSVAQQVLALAVSANATIDITTSANNPISRKMHVQNTGSVTSVYNVKRYDVNINSTATSTAEANFIFGGCDFGPQTTIGLCSLTLSPGQNSGTMGAYYSLECFLTEAGTVGFSRIKYSIYNVNQPSDSLQFTLRYNNASQVSAIADLQSLNNLMLVPNPANDMLYVYLDAMKISETTFQIVDLAGKNVVTELNPAVEGENIVQVKVQDLAPGLYFLKVQSRSAMITRKFMVE